MIKVDGPQLNTSSILHTTAADFSQQLRETSNEMSPEPPSKLRGRVQSILEPDFFSSPEMLILSGAEQQVVKPVLNEQVLTGDNRFPDGSRQVTIPRGDTGFGITVVEGKVSVLATHNIDMSSALVSTSLIIPILSSVLSSVQNHYTGDAAIFIQSISTNTTAGKVTTTT